MSHSGSSCYWECFLPALLLLTATFIICYFSGLQLGFPSSCVEICLRLVPPRGKGPARAHPWPVAMGSPRAWHLQPLFSMANPPMQWPRPSAPTPSGPAPPRLVRHVPFILCRVLSKGNVLLPCPSLTFASGDSTCPSSTWLERKTRN